MFILDRFQMVQIAGADPGKNLTGLLESEHRIYRRLEACSPAKDQFWTGPICEQILIKGSVPACEQTRSETVL